MAMLLGGSIGHALGNPAGIIEPDGAVLAILVGAVGAWGPGDAHLLTGLKEQGINSSCF